MNFNKKGFFPGWQYIVSFFLTAIVTVFIIGMYDFSIVEMYEPVHDKLNESLVSLNITSGLAYEGFANNSVSVHGKNLPFNIIFIFVFFYAVIFSLIDVSRQNKLEPMELIFKTVGGIIFFLYLMQLIVLKLIDYFQLQIVEYIFEDLILSYIPFYLFTYTNMGKVALIWAIALILANWFFGQTKKEFDGVFGQ